MHANAEALAKEIRGSPITISLNLKRAFGEYHMISYEGKNI